MSYYVVKVSDDRYDLRQERFRKQFEAGAEDPRDLMAVHFTREFMLKLIKDHFENSVVDTSAMDSP